MPSDFISLLSADLDLESPKSLYSKGESAAEAAQGLLRSPRRPARIAGGRAVGASQQAVARCLRAPPASREQPGPGGCGCAEASLGGAGGRPKAEAPFPESPEGRRRRPERRPGKAARRRSGVWLKEAGLLAVPSFLWRRKAEPGGTNTRGGKMRPVRGGWLWPRRPPG